MFSKFKSTSVMRKIFLFIVPLLFCVFSISAQSINADENAALSLVSASKAKLGLSAEDLSNVIVSSTYYDNTSGIRMVYLLQTYKGVPVYNQMLVLAFKGDKLVSNAGSFNHGLKKWANTESVTPSVSAESAVQSAMSDRGLHASQMAIAISRKNNGQQVEFSNMGISRENITANLMWTPVENSNEVRLTWQVYIIPKTTSDYWMVRVDANNNSILGMDNYTDYDNWGTPDLSGNVKYPAFMMGAVSPGTAENNLFDFKKAEDPSVITTATYRVIPIPAESPIHPGGAPALRTDPWLAAPGNATSLKWNTGLGGTDYNYSRGNNVWAYQDRANANAGSIAASASSTTALPNLTFDFVPNFTVDPTQTTPVPNQQFNTVNLFYWNNVVHDVMYGYGFNEVSGNFQDDNQGRGGAGNDHVNAEAQDGSGTNNANFSSPADGGAGRMQMYLWTGGTPNRDGDVDNGIILHEFTHGISNRLTGGPAAAGCLGNAEQMGEGWSDYVGLMLTQDWAAATLNTGFNSPRGIGTYALFQPITGAGIRPARYCTDMAVNNYTYANLPAMAIPHGVGFVWCTIIWDMTWNIINQNGTINPNIYNLAGGGGNTIALKLVTEGLKIQQCSPGFVSGRNAILQADQILYGGTYSCAIWEAFRRRGVGAFASEGSTSSITDQIVDFTPPVTLGATVSATTIPEGSNLTYTNSVATCSAITNYTLRDTLPTNVTYVSGGTYDAPNRVVSFPVNQAIGTTNYPFIVNVNPGSYFAPVTLFNETVPAATIPAAWTTTAPLGSVWTVSTTVSNSAPNSFYVVNLAADGDQRLATTSSYAIPLNSYAELSFWHKFNTEDGWDGGVVEISSNGGTTWNDVGAVNMVLNGYNGGLGVSPNNPLGGRAAFTGIQNTFINTKISLASYAGQSVMIRFRFGSDNNTSAPTTPAGWWVDDIVLNYAAAVNMRSSLFNAANTRVSFKDMTTLISQVIACAPVINQQPVDVSACAGTSASYTCVGTATGGVTYQWQISTTGIAGTYTNIPVGAPYSGTTASIMTVNPTVVGMNGNYYRCIVTGTCAPNATSNPAMLSVAASSVGGTVTPANSQVCGTTNSGTLTLSGHVGNVIRWESSTVSAAGPFTPIANTAATYTFNNITQTTWYRAVVQFGTCTAVNSTVAMVTFVPSAPMVIVADPGTTLCEGDPTRLTAMDASGPPTAATVAVTGFLNNNANATILFNFKNNNATAATITGIESICSTAGLKDVTVLFKTSAINGLPGALTAANGWNPMGTAVITGIANTTTTVTQPFLTGLSLVVPPGATYGICVQAVDQGTTTAAQRYSTIAAGTYTFSAAGCDIITGTNVGYGGVAIPGAPTFTPRGFMGKVNVLAGSALVPITSGTFVWSPAAGLSSTTTNPVAASPMTTTTYTVSHNNGLGCTRQANITIIVNQRPKVTTHPVSRTNCAGSTATFTVVGTGTTLTYQWQQSLTGCAGTWANLADGGAYSGTATAVLTINPVAGSMTGYAYRCVLGGACAPIGTQNVSNCATLTVNPLPIVTITPAGPVCGGVAGINGTQLSTASAPPPVPGTVTVNSGTISVPVPDNDPAGATHTLAVSTVPANATLTNIHVKWTMPHTWVGDMVFALKAPNGQILNLDYLISITGVGPSTGFVNTTVSSAGVNALSTGTNPYTGTFRADAVITNVNAGAGGPTGFTPTATTWAPLYTTANGNWVLAMKDGFGGDVGTLTNWTITFDYTTPGTTGSPLTYTWSPVAGLYMDPQATVAYTAGTQTPVVYAAPTVLTLYTATGTNTVTGCVGTSTVLVNYTPGAPVVTPNPVAMCLGDIPVKLKSSSTGTPAIWSPALGLFSNAAGSTAYIAGTAVDSVWAKPLTIGANTYTATVQSQGLPPNAIQTTFANNNQFGLVTSNFKNNNAFPVTITGIESIASTAGASTATLYYKTTAINGAPGAISAANGWITAGTGTYTAIANTTTTTPQPMLSGLSLSIPAGATYGLAFESSTGGVGNLRYSTVAAGTYTDSQSGCDLISGTNVSFAGDIAPIAPTFTPRAFIGKVLFGSNNAPCISAPRTVVVTVNQPTTLNAALPANQTICTDKVATFSAAVTVGTGPHSYQWQLSTNGGGTFTNIANGGIYSGATTATLTVTAPPVTAVPNQYRCVVTGASPCAAVISRAATLTVNPLPVIALSVSPYTSLYPGLRTTISSTVGPNPAATYSWLRDGVVLSNPATGVVSGLGTGSLLVDVDGMGVYRLSVTDANGCTNMSTNSITIKDSASAKCFMYPNPTSGRFEVRFYSLATNVLPRTLTIYNMQGQRVYTKMFGINGVYDRMSVDMRRQSKGVYTVEIGDRNGNRITICKKLVIQ
jgi:subtilisin-like proprotein convertase family protein